MSCPPIHELSAFFDDHVAPAARLAIERHVSGCALCARQLAGFAHTRRELGLLRDVGAPPRLLPRLAAAAPGRSPSPGLPLRAAAALLGGLSLLFARTALGPTPDRSPIERHVQRALPLFEARVADAALPARTELALLRQLATQEKPR